MDSLLLCRQGTPEELREAIKQAEAAGVSALLLDDARELLRRCEQQLKAMEDLRQAMSTGDMAELRAAIRQGQAAALPAEDLAAAMEKLAQLEETEAQQQKEEEHRQKELERQAMLEEARREHAAEMLRDASSSRDVDALRAAIAAANKAGLDTEAEALATARQILGEEEAKAAARSSLEAAIASGDLERLREALSRAESAGLDEPSLGAARKALKETEAQAAARRGLREVLEASRSAPKGLEAVLQAALSAGLGGTEADAALLAAVRQRAAEEAVRERLAQAMSGGDAEELRRALDAAIQTGLTGQVLEEARSLLQTLVAREAAKKELKDAAGSGDLDRLRAALESAESLELGESDKEGVTQKLRELERRATASRRLKDAMDSGEAQALRAALEEAADAGVTEHLDAARAALAQSEERAQLARTLQHVSAQAKPVDAEGSQPGSPTPTATDASLDGRNGKAPKHVGATVKAR